MSFLFRFQLISDFLTLKKKRLDYQRTNHVIMFVFFAAVHCEGFSGGEYGEDPEEETGPDGEGIRIHKH